MARTEANWVEINPTSLSEGNGLAYEKYKALYRQAKEARVEFEEAMNDTAGLPMGKRLVFGYNFGKLSVAVVDDDRKAKASAGKGAQSLSAFLAGQQAAGRRA